ncbi:MAG: sigma-70 family RNA polymerase sigma factor [Bacteroidota bacterium]
MSEKELIEACKKGERRAQQMLYDRYSPKMFGLCRRYVRKREDAEDVLIDGFYKVLTNIGQFQGNGSFEGWIRRIMVNEALMFLRKKQPFQWMDELQPNMDVQYQASVEDDLAAQDILNLLDQLPAGYRTIFNLYVIEGFKHREIAETLGISINTSKSQLILAKKRLKTMVIKNEGGRVQSE